MRKLKRLSILMLSVLMMLSMSGCSKKDPAEEQKKFDEFINRQFVSAMESDYTTAHVFLQNPEKFDVDTSKIEVNLGARIDMESIQKDVEEQETIWKEFKDFDYDCLTEEQKDTYDIYEYQNKIIHESNDGKYDYYAQLFESMTGIHYQLPTLLADWDLRNEQDVKDLILLVKDVEPYLSGAISYTKTQAEKGLLMVDIDSVKKYCDGIIEKGETSAVLASMNENIDALNLSKEAADTYKEQLKEAFTSSFLPAYKNISNLMSELKKGTNNEEGYAKFEHGKAYYELLLQANIGSEKSVEAIKTMLQSDIKDRIQKFQKLVYSNPTVFKTLMSNTMPTTSYKSYSEILDDISSKFTDDFPKVSSLKYHIKDINEEIASDSGVAAYFNIPALDGDGIKQLRVNPSTGDINEITTYHTVAHEGFPGHMYQYGYMYDNLSSPYRKTLANSNAYTEGYAVYAQYYAFKYLDDIDQDLLAAIKENELLTYDIMILADIGIHYDGWSQKDFSNFLSEQGFSGLDEESLTTQYKQLQANPAAFEPYYVGYIEIEALKDKAQEALGDKFEDKAFHEALLKSGNAPFKVVERNIDAYIKTNK